MPNFYNCEKMHGKEFIKSMIKQQEDRYQKKFAFERGQYHQCIPNPMVANQMITVQIVLRVLDPIEAKAAAGGQGGNMAATT